MSNLKLDYILMGEDAIRKSIDRLAMEIIEHENLDGLVLVGIMRRGVPIAERLARKIKEITGIDVEIGSMEIKFYTDDLQLVSERPIVKQFQLPEDINGKVIVLVDDVIYTGKTTWAAIEKLLEMGEPSAIRLLNLVDRGHRALPMLSNYNGRVITTTDNQVVKVQLKEIDGVDQVQVLKKKD